MSTSQTELEELILKLLAGGRRYQLIGYHENALIGALRKQFPKDESPLPYFIVQAVWSLVSRGLAVIDYQNENVVNWYIDLTPKGRAAALDEEVNPDNPSKYIEKLNSSVPMANATVMQYAKDALESYNNRCYLASAVMLGVASEAAFIEMARSFGNWLPESDEKKKFISIIENERQNYLTKFLEFRKRIETHKSELPPDLSDGMALTFDSIVDLLRIYRNDAGHPTGKQISRDDAFNNLQMFQRYLHKLYAFKAYFDQKTNSDG